MTICETKPLVTLSAGDRCDQCGEQAMVAVKFRRLDAELLFCGSHFATHGDTMKAKGGRVVVDMRRSSSGSGKRGRSGPRQVPLRPLLAD